MFYHHLLLEILAVTNEIKPKVDDALKKALNVENAEKKRADQKAKAEANGLGQLHALRHSEQWEEAFSAWAESPSEADLLSNPFMRLPTQTKRQLDTAAAREEGLPTRKQAKEQRRELRRQFREAGLQNIDVTEARFPSKN